MNIYDQISLVNLIGRIARMTAKFRADGIGHDNSELLANIEPEPETLPDEVDDATKVLIVNGGTNETKSTPKIKKEDTQGTATVNNRP